MKKTLLATTLLVATAGLAVAESHSGVSFSGSGRFGVLASSGSDTSIHTRLRFNIDAKMETDGGVTFGGRIRMQYANGDISDEDYDCYWNGASNVCRSWTQGGARLSAAMLYMEANGFRVEVGNANGAYDSAGLMWNSEVGLTDTSYGDPNNSYIGYFSSGPYQGYTSSTDGIDETDAMGIFASYSSGNLTARISYHTVDQYSDGADDEVSVSVDWSANGFSVSAAHVSGDYGDTSFIGAAYAIGDSTNVGLNYFTGDYNDLITLYVNHSMGNGLTLAAYVADQDGYDTAFGLGGSYDLGGGAALKASYEDRGSSDRSSLGVQFSF